MTVARLKMSADVLRALREQCTVREYTDEMPDMALIRECVRVAQRSPSTSNHQPYSVVAIRSKELRDELVASMVSQPYVSKAPLLLLINVDWSRQDALARHLGMNSGINRMSKLIVGIADASIFAQCLVLALQAHGLGVSYIASPYTAMLRVASLLRLPVDKVMPLHLLSIGVPAERPRPRPRYPFEAIWSEEAYEPCPSELVRQYFESGARELEEDGYLSVTGDSIDTWVDHYRIKFGDVARQRTWEPLSKQVAHFFAAGDAEAG
jgi:nitroreductase